MAKVIIKENAVINGVNRLFQGDKIAFVKNICEGGNFVVTTVNNKEDKSFASGLVALKLDTLEPIIVEYRTLWGVASIPVDINGITTRTPQCLHDAGMKIFRYGSNAINSGDVYTVGDVYACSFKSKDEKKGHYQWDIVGLDSDGETVKISKTEISFNGRTAKIDDVKNAVSELVKRHSERVAEYDW